MTWATLGREVNISESYLASRKLRHTKRRCPWISAYSNHRQLCPKIRPEARLFYGTLRKLVRLLPDAIEVKVDGPLPH